MAIKLTYRPLKSEGEKISTRDYVEYAENLKTPSIVKTVAVTPLEDAMKKQRRKEFNFGDFKVTKKMQHRNPTSWEKVFNSLNKFLEIRSDDSRAYDMDGLAYFDGIGYCIAIQELKDYIKKQENKATTEFEFPQLFWPRKQKAEEYPTSISLPKRDFSVINNTNAKLVLTAKRFNSGLEKQVFDVFKEANKQWFEQRTGYSLKNLPTAEQGFVQDYRLIDNGRPVIVTLIRQETPQYSEIMSMLSAEFQDLENKVAIEGYRVKSTKQGIFVSIKNVADRLSTERLKADNLVKVEGKYEIVP